MKDTNNNAVASSDKNAVTLELMKKMRLHGMASAFEESLASTMPEAMTPDAFISWLTAREWDYRTNMSIARLVKMAGFRYAASIEEIDYGVNRNLDRNQMERLATLDFVRGGKGLFITGPAGTGKSYIATALGLQACRNGIRTYYGSASKLLGHLKMSKAKGTIEMEMKKIEKSQLLILDDLFLVPLDAKERALMVEIVEDRHNRKSTIITSQLPLENWYDAIGDATVADALLDRLVHSSHRINLVGESFRKIESNKH